MNVITLLPCMVMLMTGAPPAAPRESQPARMGPAAVRSLAAGSADGRGGCLNPITISELALVPTEFGIAGYVIDQPGFYLVSRNLSVPAVDFGILILAENVTLDLGGHAISDVSGESTLIRVTGDAVRATLRNGRLEGGRDAIVAIGDVTDIAAYERSWLLVERMVLRGGARSAPGRSIAVSGVRDVSIVSSELRGAQRAVELMGWTKSEISDSTIIATETGIETTPLLRQNSQFARGEIIGNYIRAGKALSSGYSTRIEGNSMLGEVELTSMMGRLVGNRIDGPGAATLIVSGSLNLIESNHVTGAPDVAIKILGEANRIANNVLVGKQAGINVAGAYNLIESNVIRGGGPGCAIRFENDRAHVYRGNSISGARRAVCGEPNIDGGGNTIGPACERSLMSGSSLRVGGTCDDAPSPQTQPLNADKRSKAVRRTDRCPERWSSCLP